MTITASAQRFLDEAVVAEKQDAKDYDVLVSPVFSYDGKQIRVVLDGHHSLEAAKRDGVAASMIEADATDSDRITVLERGDIEDFLEMSWVDADYYDTATGRDIW